MESELGDEPDGQNDLPCVRVADFNRLSLRVSNAPTVRSIAPNDRNGRLLKNGDLLLEKSGGGELQPVGTVVEYVGDPPAVCSNFIAKLSISPGFHARFLVYLHSTLYCSRITTRSIKQTTGIQNLDAAAYFNEYVPLPSLGEQRAIAEFLDRETARIDELIAKKERLVDLLDERRMRTIDALTADQSWARRLKFCIGKIEQGWSPQCENREAEGEEWGVLKVSAVNHGRFRPNENKALPASEIPLTEYEVRPGDVLMSRANTRALLGACTYVPTFTGRLLVCDKLYRIVPHLDQILPEYLPLALQTKSSRYQIERDATGASASMQNIGQDTVRNLVIPTPSTIVQRQIVERGREIEITFQAATQTVGKAIQRLGEYRTALISAAVTGQIDVRTYRKEPEAVLQESA